MFYFGFWHLPLQLLPLQCKLWDIDSLAEPFTRHISFLHAHFKSSLQACSITGCVDHCRILSSSCFVQTQWSGDHRVCASVMMPSAWHVSNLAYGLKSVQCTKKKSYVRSQNLKAGGKVAGWFSQFCLSSFVLSSAYISWKNIYNTDAVFVVYS